jgi:hypothetical protein
MKVAEDQLADFDPSSAWHEAGHAVIFHVLGFRVGQVDVLMRNDTKSRTAVGGRCHVQQNAEQTSGFEHIKKYAIGCLAGFEAQLKIDSGASV